MNARAKLSGELRMSRCMRALALLITVLFLICQAPAAEAAFGVESFSGEVSKADGSAETQAGAVPAVAAVDIHFNSQVEPSTGLTVPDADVQNVEVQLPPGFIGNPQNVPQCDEDVLQSTLELACPADTQVGLAVTNISFWENFYSKVYNMTPPPGVPAQFAMQLAGVVVHFDAHVRSDGDYGLTVDVSDISQKTGANSSHVEFWGVPADHSHDGLRGECVGAGGPQVGMLCPSAAPVKPFLRNPTYCSGEALITRLFTNPWSEPANVVTASFDHDAHGTPMVVDGCDRVPFTPTVEAETQSHEVDRPTGYVFKLKVPQESGVQGIAEGDLRNTVVTLPEGVSISPAAAGGLTACTNAQLGLDSTAPSQCPNSAKVGALEIHTPLLAEPLQGSAYIGSQLSDDPESGQMFRLFLVAEGFGVTIKLLGEVRANAQTGRLTATFKDSPQLPFSELELALKDGPRAPLATSQSCGEKSTQAELTSWSGKTVTAPSSFDIVCGSGGPTFAPSLKAGTESPLAGQSSPFSVQITKSDSDAEISGLRLELPPGLLASLKGNLGSQVGSATAYAGPGGYPFQLPGRVYLEGPYGNAPYSLRTVVPAVAGPFNLGDVVVKQKLYVDPTDTHVTVVSDPLPTIVKGVPVRLQRLDVDIDRPGFTLNPTNCDPKQIDSTLTSVSGQTASPSVRFQVASCERLAFRPKLTLNLSGQTRRTGNPALKAVLTQPEGENANIAGTTVILPKTMFIDQSHVNGPCTRVQFNAGACPASSILGTATAWSPLLEQPLTGPVYFRSNGGERQLPDLVADLNGEIHVTLVGFIDSVKVGKESSRVRTRFQNVPDAPVSRFVLQLKGGKRGLIENSVDLCKAPQKASVKTIGQNGKAYDFEQKLGVKCAKGAKKTGGKKKH